MTKIHGLELGLLEFGTLLFVLLGLPALLFSRRGMTSRLYNGIKERPWFTAPFWFIGLLAVIVVVLETIAVTLVRLAGEWKEDVNLTALIVFAVLQLILFLWTPAFYWSLAAATLTALIALGLAIWDTFLFFDVPGLIDDNGNVTGSNNWAGGLMIAVDVILFYAFVLLAVLWAYNPNLDMHEQCRKTRASLTYD
jgi:hypothetical protein